MNSYTDLQARLHDYEARLTALEEHPEHDAEVDVPQSPGAKSPTAPSPPESPTMPREDGSSE
jgi:hypothetical protein